MKKSILSFSLINLLALVGCGSDGDTEKSIECTENNTACIMIKAPADFSGTPVNINALLYASLPPTGYPDGILGQVPNPTFTNGEYALQISNVSASGDYFVYLAVYMEGGGATTPVAGVDYVGHSANAVTFDGSPLNIGEIQLTLYTE